MASRVALRRLLTSFCVLAAVLWAGSLSVLGVDQVLTSRRLGSRDPLAVALVFMGIELGGAFLVQRQIRKAPDKIFSVWTLIAVIAALLLALMNIVAGMAVG